MSDVMSEIVKRPRRNRKTKAIRFLVKETLLSSRDLIYPLFVRENTVSKEIISSMPGIFRFNEDGVLREVERIAELNIESVLLFPCIEESLKDPYGSFAFNPKNILLKTIQVIKKQFPHICVITELALNSYTSHGHHGLCDEKGGVLNDDTVRMLGQLALLYAESGTDMVAPSDMMDGRVRYIRHSLDEHGFSNVSVMSYAVQYASSFYAPFSEAIGSKITFGDKKNYQMDPSNKREAIREALLDEEEGADILIIKPGVPCLDILSALREKTTLPLASYQVSGEYAMMMSGIYDGWLSPESFIETAICMKRAGADIIISLAAPLIAEQLMKK